MYDCAIVGTGAAGVSAALTLRALNREFIWIGNPSLSAKIRKAEKIKNYPGLPSVTGQELCAAFSSQIREEGIAITQGKATGIYPVEGGYAVACGQDLYEAKTVVLACGVQTARPIEGEREFLGKGVSYCATCDGFLYRGKTVVAVISSDEELHEAEYLAEFAQKVYLFALYRGAKQIRAKNVEIVEDVPEKIFGGERVEGVVARKGVLKADGVFVLKDATAGDGLIAGLELRDGAVATDRACATNLRGVFAAGDCTGRPYQYAKAVGEGNVAAHSVNRYLASL